LGLDAGPNLFTYVTNNPARFTDPFGLLNDDLGKAPPVGKPYCEWGVCTPPIKYPTPSPSCIKALWKWGSKGVLKDTGGQDPYYLHCIGGCEIAKACGDTVNLGVGYLKEQWDGLGFGSKDILDIFAAFQGGECKDAPGGCECCCKGKGYKP
jgi:hypothetical protein